MWGKMLYLLQVNRVFGPLLKIIVGLSCDTLSFLALLFFLQTAFACVGLILFQTEGFTTFPHSMLTLYSWTLGAFDFA